MVLPTISNNNNTNDVSLIHVQQGMRKHTAVRVIAILKVGSWHAFRRRKFILAIRKIINHFYSSRRKIKRQKYVDNCLFPYEIPKMDYTSNCVKSSILLIESTKKYIIYRQSILSLFCFYDVIIYATR